MFYFKTGCILGPILQGDVMRFRSLTLLPAYSASLILALVLPAQALGTVAVSIHPTDSIDSLETTTDPSYLLINPNLDPVISNEGYSHTTSAEVDKSTGSIKGYAGYRLDSASTITRTGNLMDTLLGTNELALVSNVSGSIIYDATVNAPANAGPSSATVFIDVEGSFNYDFGAPSLGLLGAVSLNVAPGGDALNSLNYLLGGQYSNVDEQSLIPDAASIFTREDFLVFDSALNFIDPSTLTGITPDVQFTGTDPGALSMRVSLTVPIEDGDVWFFGGTAAGSATHAFLEDFRNIGVGDPGDVDAASGHVDFLNTASLGIVLPEGFTLEGANAPPASIITNVPLPASLWLLISGIIGMATFSKRRQKVSG